jgi:Tol biopolymer transport system component
VSLTTMSGHERHPTFSPDGEQVAFSWGGERQDNWDIYVTLVGSSEVRRLTSDPSADTDPTWSPDGRQIAFLREGPGGSTIQLVSALGGAGRKLSDFGGADSLAWAPDGHWLAAGRSGQREDARPPRGIYLIPVDGGDPRPLISSKPDHADSRPSFSPDGRQLAYASCSHAPTTIGFWAGCDIYVVELDGARAASTPRRLTNQGWFIFAITWTRDGSTVIYGLFTDLSTAL